MEQPEQHPVGGEFPFGEAARHLLSVARSESARLRHDYVGTEHLVLALAGASEDTALLTRLGVDAEQVRSLVEEAVRPGLTTLATGEALPYTSRTMKAFSLAADSARDAGHAHIEPEHILLGMFLEGKNIGAEVLRRSGLTAEQAAARVSGRSAAGGPS